jgi:hypothetical protein
MAMPTDTTDRFTEVCLTFHEAPPYILNPKDLDDNNQPISRTPHGTTAGVNSFLMYDASEWCDGCQDDVQTPVYGIGGPTDQQEADVLSFCASCLKKDYRWEYDQHVRLGHI